MRRSHSFAILVLAAGVAGACRPEEVIKTEQIPTAGVRFINAVPDSSGAFGFDFRFVDIVENNVQFRMTFRNSPQTTAGVTASAVTQFFPARAGSRHIRIFLDDTLVAIASTVVKDTIVSLEAGKNYTAILWGEGRLGTMKLKFAEDVPADPATQVALRVINATASAIDVRQYATGASVPATPTWASVPAYSVSSFVTVPVGGYKYNVRAAGAATNLIATDLTALAGAPADLVVGLDPLPGTTQAGSAVTLVVYPPSTTGARTPQGGAFAAVGGAFMWDRRPNK
jgi:hypothetical protein